MERKAEALLAHLLEDEDFTGDRAPELVRALDVAETGSEVRAELHTEILLREVLAREGGLSRSRERLLARAVLRAKGRSLRRGQRLRLRLTACAAAAALAVAAAGAAWVWQAWSQRLGAITAWGDFEVRPASGRRATARVPQRGDRIVAGPGGAHLRLGGYCELAMAAGTEVVVDGEARKEVVRIGVGRLVSRVRPGHGTYTVGTPAGTLDVKGTEFVTHVRYEDRKEADMNARTAVVTVLVLAGVVGFDVGGERGLIQVGGSRVFAAEVTPESDIPAGLRGFLGLVSGTIGEKGEDGFTVKVTKLERTWPNNKAEAPASIVGMTLRLRVFDGQDYMIRQMATVKAGDAVAVGVSQRHDFWNGAELLVPAAELPALQEKWQAEAREHEAARTPDGAQKSGANRELEQEANRLREENARLKREIEELRKR